MELEASGADFQLGAPSQAEEWGLAYEGISDLASIGGAFASIFYTPVKDVRGVKDVPAADKLLPKNRRKHPFIVLVMKGAFIFLLLLQGRS